MDNNTRSERSRNAMLQAALAIIARDGPGRLTLDAIARESGISKGGLMHQFRTKEAVLKALLEHQIDYFEEFSRGYKAEFGPAHAQPILAAEIATSREAITKSQSVAVAMLGAIAQEPTLLSIPRAIDAEKIAAIQAESADPELATLRWLAARGLMTTAMLGICPLSPEERERLFARLLDDQQWSALEIAKPPHGDG